MVKLISAFRSLRPIKVLIVGDFVLDTYITGVVSRISPEAPVPVLHAKEIKNSPGMAGNVALNLSALGALVTVAGRLGSDTEGKLLLEEMQAEGINTKRMLIQKGYQTPIKKRMIANAQQLLRVDCEEIVPLEKTLEEELLRFLKEDIHTYDVIALSDYNKGCLTRSLTEQIIGLAKEHHIPVVVDPKGDDFTKYEGATLIKPNLQEAYVAAKCNKKISLSVVADILLRDAKADYVLITRSEEGMSLFSSDGNQENFPVVSREVKDVTGAGDTVLAIMTMAMGNGLDPAQGAQLANIAASLVIQKVGCVRVDLSQIAEELLSIDRLNKVFSEEHLFALTQALLGKKVCVLGLCDKQQMTVELFRTIKNLSSHSDCHRLLVYFEHANEEMMVLLAALEEVNFILVSADSLKLFDIMKPEKVFYMRNNVLEEVVQSAHLLSRLLSNHVV